MFKITIKSQKEGVFWLEKQTQAEVDEYLAWAQESKHWGSPQWIEEVEETEDKPAYQIVHPAEYELVIEDMTAQIEAEKAKVEIVRQSQLAAVQRMQQFPDQLDQCSDLDGLKLAMKQFVSDVAILLLQG